MTKEWLWWLGEFGLVAVVAIVAGFVTRDVPISILYGLFVGTVFFSLREHKRVVSQHERQVAEMEEKVLGLPVTLSKLGEADPYMKRLAHLAKDEAIRYAKGAVDGEILIKNRAFLQDIIEMFKQAKPGDKVLSTNIWTSHQAPLINMWRQTSFDLAANGVDVTRVFIEADTFTEEDKKHQREEMDRQKDHIKVRFVKESQLPPDARRPFLVIYDRFYGLATTLGKGGTETGVFFDDVRLFTRRDEVEKGMALAETMIKLSEEYK